MNAPRLLDLFCGAGGCSVGYRRAGFEVVGVDIEAHEDYPFELITADAMDILAARNFLNGYVVVHASPPCQAYTTMSNRRRLDHPDLLEPVRDALTAWGGTYVIENVPGARSRMREPATLHGGMFGLGVDRSRLFESNVFMMLAPAPATRNPVGVYGARPDGRRLWTRADGTQQRAAASITEAGAAMGIDWMTDFRDIAEAVPPAYTEFIGRQLIDALEVAA